uniref:Hexosyltransferase n=1 Tax=Chromera velia CCMP2878 TaxID=1169474 RepID=A0A0G4IAA8_9ALVE|eukprot:Cvel_12434.t1-p1 / transcript=Cvel_12434.t1 / gene=Cvel_12434 / organism=Chromera_velia_CCMP2878 / gene_product=hypothetical protein / transcript_product=hypothetical protein / location=Cvel_scaffold813:59675-63228(+) / protein_length=771 / sequence_SO=supercontig / SO=protein_coding / is_pseudo=false
MRLRSFRLCCCCLCVVLALPLSSGGRVDQCNPLLFLGSLADEADARWSSLQEELLDLQTVLSPGVELVTFSFGVSDDTLNSGYVGDVRLERTTGEAFGFPPLTVDRDTAKILAALEAFCLFSKVAIEDGNEKEGRWEKEKEGMQLQKQVQRVARRRKASGCGGPSWLVVLRDSDLPSPVELLKFLDSELERELRQKFPHLSITDSEMRLGGSFAARFRAVAGERSTWLVRNLVGNCGNSFDAVNCAGHYVGANSLLVPGEVPLAFSARLVTDLCPATPFLKSRGSTAINVATWMVGSDDVMFLDPSKGIRKASHGDLRAAPLGVVRGGEGGGGQMEVRKAGEGFLDNAHVAPFCFRSGGDASPIFRFPRGLMGGGTSTLRVLVPHNVALSRRERQEGRREPIDVCLIVSASLEAQGKGVGELSGRGKTERTEVEGSDSVSERLHDFGFPSHPHEARETASVDRKVVSREFPFVRVWDLNVSQNGDVGGLVGLKALEGVLGGGRENTEENAGVALRWGQKEREGKGCSVPAPELLVVIASRWRNWRRRRRLRTALTAFTALAGKMEEGSVPFRFVFLLGAPPASLSESDGKGVMAEAQNSGDLLIQDDIGDEINVEAIAHTAYALERPSDGSERRHDAGLHPLAMKITRAAHLFLSLQDLPRPFWEGEFGGLRKENTQLNASECPSLDVSDWLFIVDDDSFVNPLHARRLLRQARNERGEVLDPRTERRLVANIANSPLEADLNQWVFPYFHAFLSAWAFFSPTHSFMQLSV